jgi:hypothetical protein
MKTVFPPKTRKSARTPATTPATNAGAPSDRERAPLSLVEPGPSQTGRASKPSPAEHETWPSFADDPEGATKSLLQELMFRAELYPELAQHLASAIETLQISLRRTPKSAREQVINLLKPVTGLTLEELQADMVLPEAKLWEVLNELIALKLIEHLQTGRRIMPAKGRIEHFFKLKNSSPAGSNYSSPSRESSGTKTFMDSLAE